MTPFFDVVVAIERSGGIGQAGHLPWPLLTSDMRHFRRLTSTSPIDGQQNAIIMGYTTWMSMGKALPNRINIVVSHSFSKPRPEWPSNRPLPFDVLPAGDLQTALLAAQWKSAAEVFVIGGAQLYTTAIQSPFLRYAYITTIDGDFTHDVTAPWATEPRRSRTLELDGGWPAIVAEQTTVTPAGQPQIVPYRIERFRVRRAALRSEPV